MASAEFGDYPDWVVRSSLSVEVSVVPEFDRAALVGPTWTSDVVPSECPL